MFKGKQPNSADRGIATHLVLQFCDFNNLKKNGVASEISRLIEKKFIPESTVQIVRMVEIEKFVCSELFERLCQAHKIYREQRFNIFFDAYEFSGNEELRYKLKENDEKVLVQGVIDLFFYDADDRLILCDYKTDRIATEVACDDAAIVRLMKERHGEQLSYYRRALLALCGREPDEIQIYLTQLGRSFII